METNRIVEGKGTEAGSMNAMAEKPVEFQGIPVQHGIYRRPVWMSLVPQIG